MAVLKVKDSSGNWQNIVTLKGDKGDTGDQGPAGTTSFAGLTDVPDRVKNAVSTVNGKSASADGSIDLSDKFLPLSGGTMNGIITLKSGSRIVGTSSDTWKAVDVYSSSGNSSGANLHLRCNDSSTDPGTFVLTSQLSNDNRYDLFGKPDGVLMWGNKHIVRSVNGTAADENGNVTLEAGSYPTLKTSFSMGSESATSESQVTKTITGLVIGRPAYLVAKVPSFSHPSAGKTKYYSTTANIISGAFSTTSVTGTLSGSSAQFDIGFSLTTWNMDDGGTRKASTLLAQSYTVFPCATSMTVVFEVWQPITIEVWQ